MEEKVGEGQVCLRQTLPDFSVHCPALKLKLETFQKTCEDTIRIFL